MLLTGIGISTATDTTAATQEAAQQAISPLGNHTPNLLLIFCTPNSYDQPTMLSYLKHHYSQSTIIGCSASGHITATHIEPQAISIVAIHSDKLQFHPSIGTQLAANSAQSAIQFVQQLSNPQPQAILAFPDGISANGTQLLQTLQQATNNQTCIIGGSAGDSLQFHRSYQYYGQQLTTDSIVGVGIDGPLTIGVGKGTGWIPIGAPWKVTSAQTNLIQTLNNQPAINIYRDQFGADKITDQLTANFPQFTITYPLGFKTSIQSPPKILLPLKVHPNGEILCNGDIPPESEAYLMIGSREESLNAVIKSAQTAFQKINQKLPKLILFFTSIAHQKLFINNHAQIRDAIIEVFGGNIPTLGLYTYSQIATTDPNPFSNLSTTIVAITE